jgi:hypothetical protein
MAQKRKTQLSPRHFGAYVPFGTGRSIEDLAGGIGEVYYLLLQVSMKLMQTL